MEAQRLFDWRWGAINLDRRYLLKSGLVALAYIVAAKLGLSLAYTTRQVTTVWPPSGIAIVAMLLLGRRYWPTIFVGAFVANLLTQEPVLVAVGIAAGNTLEAVVAASLVRRLSRFKNALAVPRDAMMFALAAGLGTLVAAAIGPLSLALGGLINRQQYVSVAITWWQGDLMGALVFGPFLLAYLNPRAYAITKGRLVEGGLLLASTFAVSIGIFTTHGRGPLSLPFLLFPLLVWAAIRFTQLGVVTCALLIAVVAIWSTISGLGPFVGIGTIEADLIELQVFISVLSATSLIMAMAITERLAVEEALMGQARELGRLDAELKETNKRVTNILAGILEEGRSRRGNNGN